MTTVLVNPLNETHPLRGRPAPRLESLAGKRLALLDISKSGGRIFLDRLRDLLVEGYRVAEVIREVKPTFTRPAPAALIDRLAGSGVDGVIEALAD
ncbi:MAG: hypothetical protein ACE5JX_06525 [Acidobacteriota bacterium]